MGDAEYVAKQHICAGPIFVLFEPSSYVRAANLVLHKLPDPPVSFPFQQRDRFLTDVCTGLPPFSLFDQQSGWIASLYYFPSLLSSLNHVLDSCSSPPHPSFLFEPRPRFDYRSKKIHMQLEQRRFQRNLYLRVVGMWQGVRREAGSAHTTYDSEEEGVGGPPAQALGEREQRSRQWIASLAEGDRVNAAPPPLPGATGYRRLLHQL